MCSRATGSTLNALGDPFDALLAADLGVALPAEHAADGAVAAEQFGDADHLRLVLDCAFAFVGVGVGEVRRAAEHRHLEAGFVDGVADAQDIVVSEAGEEALVHFQAIGIERARHVDPVEDGHGAVARDVIEIAFGKSGDFHGSSLAPPLNAADAEEDDAAALASLQQLKER